MKPVLILASFCLVFLWGCSDSSTPGRPADGELRINLVDSPAAYDAVNLAVTEVSVHTEGADSASGWEVVNATPQTYDLLLLTNGLSEVLADHALPPGHYTQIRLKLGAGSTIVVDGVTHPLTVPSGLQSGLKLNHPFDIASDALYQLTLDFDAARSIRDDGNGVYRLQPVIRVVATQTSGTISGTVSPDSARAEVFTVVLGDTVSTAADSSGAFRLMALPAGLYDVHIVPSEAFRDTTITDVAVTAAQDKNLGIIELRQ